MTKEMLCSNCVEPTLANPTRRDVIKIAIVSVAGLALIDKETYAAAGIASKGEIKPGDFLVADDAGDIPVPLAPSDLKPGRPLVAYPYDAAENIVRSSSRFNKIVLLRLDEAELNPETKIRAAEGVLGFSAICTHQACEVKTWISKQKVLACYCHGSLFQPLESGAVIGGPAPRPLPTIPLKIDNGKLVIAGPFSAAPGTAS